MRRGQRAHAPLNRAYMAPVVTASQPRTPVVLIGLSGPVIIQIDHVDHRRQAATTGCSWSALNFPRSTFRERPVYGGELEPRFGATRPGPAGDDSAVKPTLKWISGP